MKQLASALLALLFLLTPVYGAEVDSGGVYCFSEADFADEALTGICVTAVPAAGQILLGDRVIRAGDILTVQQASQMTFAPASTETNVEAAMTYLPIYPDRVETAATMTIEVIGKQNKAPVAEDSALETYKNLSNQDKLKAEDPEGEALAYTITRQPKRGTVTIQEDGTFTYEPKKNKVGVDSFTYTAADPAGNVSREATVTITILKPTEATQYTDTAGHDCRFAAEWMKNTGIFVAETINGNPCFQPDKPVSRGEFLTMMVSALELNLEEAAQSGVSEDTPDWLKPYVSAALRSGLTAGLPDGMDLSDDRPITGAEAAVMLQNALDLSMPDEVEAGEDVPTWAADAVTVLGAYDIILTEDDLTRAEAAQVLYQTSKLASDAPGMTVLQRMQ